MTARTATAHTPGVPATALPQRAMDPLAQVRRRALQRVLLLVVLLVALSVASPLIQQVTPTKSYAVASESMEPGIPKGALVVTSEQPVDVGDVVVYWSPLGEYQVHRIIETTTDGDRVFYRTAGDANTAEDAFLVPAEDVQGKVVGHTSYMGYLWLLPDWFQFTAFSGAILLYLMFTAWEARTLLRRRLQWLPSAAVLVVLITATPAFAGIGSDHPDTTKTAAVASSAFPLTAGTMASTDIASDQNTATVTVPAPRLWKEIPMWNCKKEANCTNPLSPGFSEETGSWARIDMAHYAPVPEAYFEAYVAAPAGQTAMVHLYDTTNNVEVTGSQVSTTGTDLTLVRSGAFSLSGVKDYTIRSGHTGTGQGGTIAHARLLLVQDLPTKTADQVRLSQGTEEATTTWAVPARAAKWRFDGAATDGIASAHFEVIAEVDGDMLTSSHVRLMDRTAGTIVTTLTVGILDTRATRFVSADIQASLIDGHEYEIEVQRGEGLLANRLHLYVSRLHILQSDFTETVRYVDLSWKTTTTATTFVANGHPGQYHMQNEWGGRHGYFEVTMRNSDAAGTSSATLYDQTGGTSAANSTLTVTGTNVTRARSATIDLGLTNATYLMQFKASSGTAEIRQAWLIVHQGPGKTYDRVLSTQRSEDDGCTWAVTVAHVASTDLSRIRHGTIAIRATDRQDQIQIETGAVVQSTGTAVEVAHPTRIDYLVVSDPGTSGTTTIETEQRAHCTGSGIRIVQPVAFVLS